MSNPHNTNSDKVWHEAVRWIESNGGYVHPKLHYDDTHRQVYLGKQQQRLPPSLSSALCQAQAAAAASSELTIGHSPPSKSNKASNNIINAGTTLLEIPDSCLVTLHSVEADESLFGKSLFEVVHNHSSLLPPSASGGSGTDKDDGHIITRASEKYLSRENNDSGENVDSDDNDDGLYHDAQDVILALYLAYMRQQLDFHEEQQESSSSNNIGINATSSTATAAHPWLFYQPYLATLPPTLVVVPVSSSSTDKAIQTQQPSPSESSEPCSSPNNNDSSCNLPRQWSASTLKRRLQGTSLYNRILKEKEGLKREYDLVRKAWLTKNNNGDNGNDNGNSNQTSSPTTNIMFPSFEHYDNMMAVLTSRGFSGLGYDGVDTLIPLLDMLNHVRRGAGNDDNVTNVLPIMEESSRDSTTDNCCTPKNAINKPAMKNRHGTSAGNVRDDPNVSKMRGGPDIRYERYDENDSRVGDAGLPSPKRKRMENEINNGVKKAKGGVRVSTSHSLPMGSALQMTYGAKGNAALLGRYGFCIPNNVEPDGSCNDVLEINIKSNDLPVMLQRGPKSYSYGPFVKALESFYDVNREENCIEKGDDNCDTARDDREHNIKEVDDEGDQMVNDGGLEAFLDSCDNELVDDDDGDDDDDDECDESDGFGDYFYNTSTNSNATQAITSSQTSMMTDIARLDAFKDFLQNVKAGCVKNPLAGLFLNNQSRSNTKCDEKNINTELSNTTAEDQYCAILLRSEIQTCDFYLAAASELRRRLMVAALLPSQERSSKSQGLVKEGYDFDNKEVVHEQVNAVATAFLSIRYPHIETTTQAT
mmetsp:Transcript_3787/g.8436  ORF Transcript_3787/g.8436 Transcript_3787/m.8436 type:complete len:816 (-) Transcript_3787:136-2583(-)